MLLCDVIICPIVWCRTNDNVINDIAKLLSSNKFYLSENILAKTHNNHGKTKNGYIITPKDFDLKKKS